MTTFNPDLSVLRDQLRRTVPQVKQLIVVDNGSVAADSIRALVEEFAKTRWFSLGENRGLGYAHNVGIQQALERGAGSVLILDQDTLPEPDMVSVLAETLVSSNGPDSRVAAVGARYVGVQSSHPSFFRSVPPISLQEVFLHRMRCPTGDPSGCADFIGRTVFRPRTA